MADDHDDQNDDVEELSHLADVRQRIFSVAFHPYLPLIAFGCENSVIKIWSLQENVCRYTLSRVGRVLGVAFSTDGRFLATAHSAALNHIKIEYDPLLQDKRESAYKINLWNVQDNFRFIKDSDSAQHKADKSGKKHGAPNRALHTRDILSIAFCPASVFVTGMINRHNAVSMIASGSADGRVKLWDYQEDEVYEAKRSLGQRRPQTGFAKGNVEKRSGDDRKVRLRYHHHHDKADRACMEGRVAAVAFSTNGDLLAASVEDQPSYVFRHILIVWRIDHARQSASSPIAKFLLEEELLNAIHSVAFFPSDVSEDFDQGDEIDVDDHENSAAGHDAPSSQLNGVERRPRPRGSSHRLGGSLMHEEEDTAAAGPPGMIRRTSMSTPTSERFAAMGGLGGLEKDRFGLNDTTGAADTGPPLARTATRNRTQAVSADGPTPSSGFPAGLPISDTQTTMNSMMTSPTMDTLVSLDSTDEFNPVLRQHSSLDPRGGRVKAGPKRHRVGSMQDIRTDGADTDSEYRIVLGGERQLLVMRLRQQVKAVDGLLAVKIGDTTVHLTPNEAAAQGAASTLDFDMARSSDEEDNTRTAAAQLLAKEKAAFEEADQGKLNVQILINKEIQGAVTAVAVAPDGYYFLTGDRTASKSTAAQFEYNVQLWNILGDAVTSQRVGRHFRDIAGVAFSTPQVTNALRELGSLSSTESYLASASHDESVRLWKWDVKTGRLPQADYQKVLERPLTGRQRMLFEENVMKLNQLQSYLRPDPRYDNQISTLQMENEMTDMRSMRNAGRSNIASGGGLAGGKQGRTAADIHAQIQSGMDGAAGGIDSAQLEQLVKGSGQSANTIDVFRAPPAPSTGTVLAGDSDASSQNVKSLDTFDKFARNIDQGQRRGGDGRKCRGCEWF